MKNVLHMDYIERKTNKVPVYKMTSWYKYVILVEFIQCYINAPFCFEALWWFQMNKKENELLYTIYMIFCLKSCDGFILLATYIGRKTICCVKSGMHLCICQKHAVSFSFITFIALLLCNNSNQVYSHLRSWFLLA